MVMLVEPLVRALQAIRAAQQAAGGERLPVIMFSPAGGPDSVACSGAGAVAWRGALVRALRGGDQRFIDAYVDEEVSMGDYVLSGGELPALTLMDAVARLQPGCCMTRLRTNKTVFLTVCSIVRITVAPNIDPA